VLRTCPKTGNMHLQRSAIHIYESPHFGFSVPMSVRLFQHFHSIPSYPLYFCNTFSEKFWSLLVCYLLFHSVSFKVSCVWWDFPANPTLQIWIPILLFKIPLVPLKPICRKVGVGFGKQMWVKHHSRKTDINLSGILKKKQVLHWIGGLTKRSMNTEYWTPTSTNETMSGTKNWRIRMHKQKTKPKPMFVPKAGPNIGQYQSP